MNCPTEEGDILGDSLGVQGVSPLTLHENLLQLQGRGLRPNSITSGLDTVKELRTDTVDGRRKQPAFPIKGQPMEKLSAADGPNGEKGSVA